MAIFRACAVQPRILLDNLLEIFQRWYKRTVWRMRTPPAHADRQSIALLNESRGSMFTWIGRYAQRGLDAWGQSEMERDRNRLRICFVVNVVQILDASVGISPLGQFRKTLAGCTPDFIRPWIESRFPISVDQLLFYFDSALIVRLKRAFMSFTKAIITEGGGRQRYLVDSTFPELFWNVLHSTNRL